jgi:hypothetical protein
MFNYFVDDENDRELITSRDACTSCIRNDRNMVLYLLDPLTTFLGPSTYN